MTSRIRNHRYRALTAVIVLSALTFVRASSPIAQTRASTIEPDETTRVRLQVIVDDILAAWNKADVVCLGEDHGSRNDSDLRITLVKHPDFARKVRVIVVESANVEHQDVLDRFILEGEEMTREKLRVVWADANGHEVWDSPIYEAFLRAVHNINLKMPRERRVRLLAGDNPKETNRGKFIRDFVSREILSKGIKGLTIYGSGHCECRGGGFPGELTDKYPGRIWAASSFYNVEEGRRVFDLGDESRLIPITGTDRAKLPAGKMFSLGRYNDPATLGDMFDAIVYYGSARDVKVHPVKP